MESNDWSGLPPVGTRVRVPYANAMWEGEVVLLHRIFGEPLARVRVQLPVSHEPFETRARSVSFSAEQFRDEIEIIFDRVSS
jgi:hypothetical protein